MIVSVKMLTIPLMLTISLMLNILVHLDFFHFPLAASTFQKEFLFSWFQIFQKMFLELNILVTMQRNYFGDWWNISNRRDQNRMIGEKDVYICLIITSPNFADLTSIDSFGSTRLRGLRIRFTSLVKPLSKFIFGTFSPSQCSAPPFQSKGTPWRKTMNVSGGFRNWMSTQMA